MNWRTIDERLQRLPTTMTAVISLLLGIALSGLPFTPLLDNKPDLKSFLLGVGCSLIASSLVVLLASKSTFRRNKTEDLTEQWGLYDIYESRQYMNNDSNVELKFMSDNLDIMAWGLSAFRDQHEALIQEKVKKGLRMRILAPHPDSGHVKQRAIEEGSAPEQIKLQIEALAKWIAELKKNAKYPGDVDIRFYESLPQSHYMRVDNNIYIGPYFYKKKSQQTVSMSFKDGDMLKLYTTYFDALWTDASFCKHLK